MECPLCTDTRGVTHSNPRLLINANPIKWFKTHILFLDFDWCPIEVMFTLPIKWTSTGTLGWIALPPHSSLMKCKDSYLRRGELKETHLPHDRTRNRSFGPQSYTSSFTMGPWTFSSCSIRRSSHSLHEHEVLFWFITKSHAHPWFLQDPLLCQVATSCTIIVGFPIIDAL